MTTTAYLTVDVVHRNLVHPRSQPTVEVESWLAVRYDGTDAVQRAQDVYLGIGRATRAGLFVLVPDRDQTRYCQPRCSIQQGPSFQTVLGVDWDVQRVAVWLATRPPEGYRWRTHEPEQLAAGTPLEWLLEWTGATT